MHTTTNTQDQALDEAERLRDLQALIKDWDRNGRPVIDAETARMLAAALQHLAGGALDQFARTGTLDANTALAELNEVLLPLERETWIDALGQFILEGDRP